MILPVCEDIPIRTYLYYALYNSIILTRKEFIPYLFNQYIQLIFFKDKSLPYISLDYYHIKSENSDIFEKEVISKNTLAVNNVNIIKYLINALNSNYYSIIYLNEYYIPNRGSYNLLEARYYMHESLIYGVDEEKEIFYCLGYNESYRYKKSEIPFKNLDMAFNDTHENNKLYLLKLNNSYIDYSLEVPLIYKQLKEYYSSVNSYEENKIINSIEILDVTRKDFLNAEYGLNALKYIASYIQNIIDGIAKMDLRCFFLLKEHKNFMIMRLEYLMTNYILKEKEGLDIISQYRIVNKYTNIVFNLFLKYNKRYDINDLYSMKNYILLIYNCEKHVLEILLENLELYITTGL